MDWLNTLASGATFEWLPLAGLVLLLVMLAAAETFWPFHRDQRDSAARLPGNFGLGILNMILVAILPMTAVAAAQWSQQEGLGLLHRLAAPTAVAIIATLLVRSLLAYALHRLAHRVPLLWRMHKIHHCDTAVDLSTGFRHHPLEVIYVALAGIGVAASLGLSPVTLALYEVAALGFALWTHANTSLPERADRTATLLLVTSAVHHVHHSARQAETDSNYGDVLTFWDRLFGTYRAPPHDEVRAIRFGLGEAHDAGAADMLVQLRAPFSAAPRERC